MLDLLQSRVTLEGLSHFCLRNSFFNFAFGLFESALQPFFFVFIKLLKQAFVFALCFESFVCFLTKMILQGCDVTFQALDLLKAFKAGTSGWR
ncbi:hypothetical protein D3C87_1399640 [compost metagenome]